MKPDIPYSLKGVSLFDEERSLLGRIVDAIYQVYRGTSKEAVMKYSLESFMQIMEIRSGRWVRKSTFQIGHEGARIDVKPSSSLLSIRDE